jgi:hypothetical protein
MNSIHIIYIFCVLVLKVATIYFEPSWIEIYEYFNEFIIFCTFVDAWFFLVFIRHKTFEGCDHD